MSYHQQKGYVFFKRSSQKLGLILGLVKVDQARPKVCKIGPQNETPASHFFKILVPISSNLGSQCQSQINQKLILVLVFDFASIFRSETNDLAASQK